MGDEWLGHNTTFLTSSKKVELNEKHRMTSNIDAKIMVAKSYIVQNNKANDAIGKFFFANVACSSYHKEVVV